MLGYDPCTLSCSLVFTRALPSNLRRLIMLIFVCIWSFGLSAWPRLPKYALKPPFVSIGVMVVSMFCKPKCWKTHAKEYELMKCFVITYKTAHSINRRKAAKRPCSRKKRPKIIKNMSKYWKTKKKPPKKICRPILYYNFHPEKKQVCVWRHCGQCVAALFFGIRRHKCAWHFQTSVFGIWQQVCQ